MNTSAPSSLALFGILAFLQSAPAGAADVETGVAPVCDTQKHVERLASLMDYSTKSAIHTVNSEERDPRACRIANMAYLRGDRIGTVRTQEATFEIVKILVVGMMSGQSIQETGPTVYFSLLKIDERAA